MQPRLDGYAVCPVVLQRLHTVYYDTDDLRLAHWGCSLRWRHGQGWTFKIPVLEEALGLVREEHVFPGDGTRIPAGVLDLGTAYFRGKTPAPVTELRTLRTSRRIVSDGGRHMASVVEDDVRVIDGTRVVKRFRQIEIELTAAAADRLLDDLGVELRRHGAGRPDPTPKNVRAIGRRSRGPEIEAPTLDGHSRIGEVVRAALVVSVEQIVRSDSRLRSSPDERAIHYARVAVRRLRSNLAAFLPVLEFDRGCALRERLSWLQDGLSKARDADVFLAGIGRLGESLPDVDHDIFDNVRRSFDDERQRAYERMGAMLRDQRYVSLLCDLVEAAKHPPLNQSAAEPACEAMPALMADAWSTLRKRIRRRANPPSDSELHAIRIAAKRVRYIAEAIAPVAGAVARKLAASAARMQTILGEQHDAVVARERLRTVAADSERAFVAGELAACATFAGLGPRSGWEKAWRHTKRRHRRFIERSAAAAAKSSRFAVATATIGAQAAGATTASA